MFITLLVGIPTLKLTRLRRICGCIVYRVYQVTLNLLFCTVLNASTTLINLRLATVILQSVRQQQFFVTIVTIVIEVVIKDVKRNQSQKVNAIKLRNYNII